jgi:hypothetical protein
MPPLGEATLIGDHTLRIRAESQRMVGLVDRQVVRLGEYRQALITAAVTGQLDVPAGEAT